MNAKMEWKPAALLAPVPVVIASCIADDLPPNLITLAWAGTICSDPPMVTIGVRPERYSYNMIQKSGEFVLNMVSRKLGFAADLCGVISGRDGNKFERANLTPEPSVKIKAPGIRESPLGLECVVRSQVKLGTHDMFVAEIVAVRVAGNLLNKSGKLCLERAELITFSHGEYYELGKRIDHFGWSVRKKRKRGKK